MVGKLSTIMVIVKDMGRSVKFYRDVLGLPLEYESPHWSQFDVGNIKLGLHPEGKEAKVAPNVSCSFGFHVGDIRKTFADLKAKGAKVAMEPHEQDFGWLGIIADPDGYSIQFVQEKPRRH